VVEETWKVLNLLGVDKRYLRLKWISASEGNIFAEEMRSFTHLLEELGKNPLADTSDPSPAVEQSGHTIAFPAA
jgi:coenzyme F420-reducing hydrogenase delta subunit